MTGLPPAQALANLRSGTAQVALWWYTCPVCPRPPAHHGRRKRECRCHRCSPASVRLPHQPLVGRTAQPSATGSHRSRSPTAAGESCQSGGRDQNGDERFWNAPRVPVRGRKEQVIFRRAESSRTRRTRGILEGSTVQGAGRYVGAVTQQCTDSGSGGRRMTRFSLPTVPQKFSAAVPVRSDQCCIECGGCRTGRDTTQRAERAIRPSWPARSDDAVGRAHSEEKICCSSPRCGWVAEHGDGEGGPCFRASAGSTNCGRPTPGRVSCWVIGRCLSEAVQLGAWSSLPQDFHSATSRAYHATQREAD